MSDPRTLQQARYIFSVGKMLRHHVFSNITKVEMPNEEQNLAHMEFEVKVSNRDHLKRIYRSLENSEYVFEIDRIGSPSGRV